MSCSNLCSKIFSVSKRQTLCAILERVFLVYLHRLFILGVAAFPFHNFFSFCIFLWDMFSISGSTNKMFFANTVYPELLELSSVMQVCVCLCVMAAGCQTWSQSNKNGRRSPAWINVSSGDDSNLEVNRPVLDWKRKPLLNLPGWNILVRLADFSIALWSPHLFFCQTECPLSHLSHLSILPSVEPVW